MSITAQLTTIIEVSYKEDYDRDIAIDTEVYNTRQDSRTTYVDGSNTSTIDRIYSKRRSLTAASGTDDLDLSNLDPGEPHAVPINFDKVRAIYIKNREPVDEDGANLIITPSPSNGWSELFDGISSGKIVLGPQDEFVLTRKQDGIDCPTNASTLRITHDGGSSGAVEYDIIIAGTV